MSKKPFDAEFTARVMERIASDEDAQKRIAPKTKGIVDKDVHLALKTMRIEEQKNRVAVSTAEVEVAFRSTTFGKFTIAVRRLFGLPAVSRKSIDAYVFRQSLRAEAENVRLAHAAERSFQEKIKDTKVYNLLYSPPKPRDFPDAKTMKTQPVSAALDADPDPCTSAAAIEPAKAPQLGFSIDPKTAATKPMVIPPQPVEVPDTKVNITIIQGIIFYELPLPTSFSGYDRDDLTDQLREHESDALCRLVEKNVLFVIYWYGSAPYEGAGDLVVVFDDGSVDTIGLRHCSCNGPLDDLTCVKRGAFKDFATFRQSLSQEARERDYSTILAFVDGGYELPKVDAPGAQTIQEFPGFAYVTVPPSQKAHETLDGSILRSIAYKENKPAKKRAKKAKTIKKTAPKRRRK